MGQTNGWLRLVESNPEHSQWYIDRFRGLADSGADLHGEGRFVDAMVPRGSRILDAGCGFGRVGAYLAAAGHDVVGVDIDPVLIAAAQEQAPKARWILSDLAELDLAAHGVTEGFDVVVCAGNVMTFLAAGTRRSALGRMRAQLRAGGRVVVGFGAGRDYDFAEFLADAADSGLAPEVLLSTWDLRAFAEGAEFLVAVLGPTSFGPEVPAERR
jgi:SAM-dependent methyltransferase